MSQPEKNNTSFRGDVLRLVTGTGFAQLIAVIAMPILTRIFGPEAFGVAAIFTSITAVFGIVACMRYELAIVLPQSDKEAANLLILSLAFSAFFTLIVSVATWSIGSEILRWASAQAFEPYLWMIPVMVFIGGAFLALNYWNTRTKHFTRLGLAKVTDASVTNLGSISLGLMGNATGGALIGASAGGKAITLSLLSRQIWREDGALIRKSASFRGMLESLKKYKNFPIYATWSGLLNVLSWQAPVIIFGTFFSASVAGFYALGFKLIQMPLSLIGGAISQVFHQRAATAHNSGELGVLVGGLFSKLFIVGLLPLLTLAVIGRDLFELIFGKEWSEAGAYAQILAPWAIIWFSSGPLSNIYGVLGRQREGLKINIALLLTRIFSLGFGVHFGSPHVALILFSASGILVYFYMLLKIFDYSHVPRGSVYLNLKNGANEVAPYFALILLSSQLIDESIALVFVSLLVYISYALKNKKSLLISRIKDEHED